jgi:hypothetical protein
VTCLLVRILGEAHIESTQMERHLQRCWNGEWLELHRILGQNCGPDISISGIFVLRMWPQEDQTSSRPEKETPSARSSRCVAPREPLAGTWDVRMSKSRSRSCRGPAETVLGKGLSPTTTRYLCGVRPHSLRDPDLWEAYTQNSLVLEASLDALAIFETHQERLWLFAKQPHG